MIKDWCKNVIDSGERIAIPIMTHPGIELIGTTVLDVVTDGEAHFKAINALHKNSDSAAVTTAMDLTIEAEAFGCKIIFKTNEIPAVSERLIHKIEKVNELPIPELKSSKRLNEYLRAVELAVNNIRDVPVFSGCIGPFSLAGRLLDMTEIMTGIYTDPDLVHVVIEKCTSFLKQYIREHKSRNADGIIIAEPAAGLLGENECDKFSSEYIKEIVDELQDDNFLIILHNCGHNGILAKSMESTGAKALHFGNAADMLHVLESVSDDILVMGNIDPVNVLQTKTPEFVKQETMKLLEETKKYPNFILSSGCDMPPGVPQENIKVFFEALEEFNSENI
jgi:uroporphyrinogen decarboxylase